MRFLLDTNACIDLMQGKPHVATWLAWAGPENCCISEITVAELLYGAENSKRPEHHLAMVQSFINSTVVVPVAAALHVYAKQKAKLKKTGTLIDDFDLLIGATSLFFDLTLVTNNNKDFARIEGINLTDWRQPPPDDLPPSPPPDKGGPFGPPFLLEQG